MAEPRKPDPRRPAPHQPTTSPPTPPTPPTPAPEEKKILDEEFQSQALEICRQELKKMEFWAKCKEVLEASVGAESGLANKRAALEAADKAAKDQEEAHETALESRRVEALRVKADLENEVKRKEIELGKRLAVLSKSVDDITVERNQLSAEVERLRADRSKEMDELQKFRDQVAERKATMEKIFETDKANFEAELNRTREMIRNLKSTIAGIPS